MSTAQVPAFNFFQELASREVLPQLILHLVL